MDAREMIHDFVASVPEPSARTRNAARAALQAQINAESERARRKSVPLWKWRVPTASVAALLALVAVFVVNPLLRGGSQTTAAAAVLRAASHTAARQPAHVLGPGEYAYTRTEGAYFDLTNHGDHVWGALVRTSREAWIALGGSGRIRQTSEQPVFLVPTDRARWEAAGSPPLSELSAGESYDRRFAPGGLAYPLDIDGLHHDQLFRLADDPNGLGAAIRAQAETNSNPLGWEMLVIVGDLLRESVAPPRLRASLYEVATTIPGIEFVGPATDRAGRHGIAVAVTRNDLRYELIFDPKTSQLLAEAETLIQRSSDTDAPPGTPISYTLFLDSRITHSLTEPDGSK